MLLWATLTYSELLWATLGYSGLPLSLFGAFGGFGLWTGTWPQACQQVDSKIHGLVLIESKSLVIILSSILLFTHF